MTSATVSQLVLLVAVLCSGAVAYVSHSRRAPTSEGLTVTCLGVCVNLGAYLVEPLAMSGSPTVLVSALSLTGSTLIIGGWIYLSATFSDNDWLVEEYRILILAAPMAGVAAVHWIATVWPAVLDMVPVDNVLAVYSAYAYGLVAVSLALLGRHYLSVEAVYRRQTAFLIVAPLSPLLTAELINYGLIPLPAELFPIGYVPTLMLTLYALHSHNLLDIVPIARETVVNNIGDAVISITDDDVIASINDPGKEMLGLSDAVVGEDLADGLAEWPEVLDAIEADETEQVSIGEKYVRVVVTPIEQGAERYGYVVHLRDITYEVERRQELRRKQAELESKNEQLDQFASVVSHDIRNPLNVAQGHLELVAEEIDDEASVEKISRSHERIENIVNSLLTLAKSGTQVEAPEPVAFADVVERARLSAGVPPQDLAFEGPDEIRADTSRLQQLLENLFRNSKQHGGEDVRIRVGPLADGAGFFVADDGPGIPVEDRQEVFEYGYTDSVDGTGFGLNIVRTIVDAHDWEVDIVDSSDGGARFEFLTEPTPQRREPSTVTK